MVAVIFFSSFCRKKIMFLFFSFFFFTVYYYSQKINNMKTRLQCIYLCVHNCSLPGIIIVIKLTRLLIKYNFTLFFFYHLWKFFIHIFFSFFNPVIMDTNQTCVIWVYTLILRKERCMGMCMQRCSGLQFAVYCPVKLNGNPANWRWYTMA